MLGQYFKLINTHMHGLPGGKVESESFSHDFRLPKCYDIPKFKEMSQSGESMQLISSARCKQFPDKVLFYIFYNMPHDKAQLNASMELQSRTWIYASEQMYWLKPHSASKRSESTKKKMTKVKSGSDKPTTVIVFNPHLWREEVVTLLED